MKKTLYSILLSAVVISVASCGGNTQKSNSQNDSLRNALSANMAELDEMNLFLDAVNTSMDSVVNMEGNILAPQAKALRPRKSRLPRTLPHTR